MAQKNILVVDDEEDIHWLMANILNKNGYKLSFVPNGHEALACLAKDSYHLVFLDLKMPQLNGIDTLREIKRVKPGVPIIIITGFAEVSSAVEAMKLGAYEYLEKPLDPQRVIFNTQRALERQGLQDEIDSLKAELKERFSLSRLMGSSMAVKQLEADINKVAPTNLTVIIQGETGVGKEIVARTIHGLSQRRDKPLFSVDCGAIPENLLESELFGYERGAFTGAEKKREGYLQLAHGGTLLLDEISNLPRHMQAKLLRALEQREIMPLGGKKAIPIDVRLIAISNLALEKEVREGRFREDLYFRLSEFKLLIPSLRERKEDIPLLAQLFLEEAKKDIGKNVQGFSDQALQTLINYHWPGNGRELKNLVRRTTLVSKDIIEPKDLKLITLNSLTDRYYDQIVQLVEAGHPLREIMGEVEKNVVRETLKKAQGSRNKAAKVLQIEPRTLYNKLKEHQIVV